MARMTTGGARFRIERLDAHQPHQALDALAIDPDTLAPQLAPDRTAAPTALVLWVLVYSSTMNG
jgi:hypothetical protein